MVVVTTETIDNSYSSIDLELDLNEFLTSVAGQWTSRVLLYALQDQ